MTLQGTDDDDDDDDNGKLKQSGINLRHVFLLWSYFK
jgi:hypothetical protein